MNKKNITFYVTKTDKMRRNIIELKKNIDFR